MADDRKKAAKSETLTIRLDQKTRFMLEFMARLRGQSLTTVVERAIIDAADATSIGSYENQKTWRNFWHVNEGIRALKVSSDGRLYPSYDEEFRLDFVKTHWPFFYTDSNKTNYHNGYIDILWIKIDDFIEIWKQTKSTDYFAAGKAMQEAIRSAGVAPPAWPAQAVPPQGRQSHNDLDDEIPF